MRRSICASVAGAALLLHAVSAAGQSDEPELEIGGLLRTGIRLEKEAGGSDGFELFDVRTTLSGRVGIVFDYLVQAEYETEGDRVRLLDGYLTIPLQPDDLLDLEIGQLKAPFGREVLLDKGDILFVERAEASTALGPNRQVGARLSGRALEGRLGYWGGVFNGNGRSFENDNDSFLFALRGEYNSIGEVVFYEDFVVQVGANLAFSRDTALEVLPVTFRPSPADPPSGADGVAPGFAEFTGDRFLWGLDFMVSHRGYFLNAEYLRGDFDVDEAAEAIPLPDGSAAIAPGAELDAEGFYIEGGYRFFGALETLIRYDSFEAALGSSGDTETSRFLVFGVNLYPGFYAKIGFQYAAGVDGTELGNGLSDGQFLVNLQLAF